MVHYTPEEAAYSVFGYVPNLAANLVGLVLFAILLAYHVFMALWYRQWWFGVTWVLTMVLELLGYIARVKCNSDITNEKMYEMQLVCLIIGPVFMTAGLYYLLAKYIQVHGVRYSRLRPMDYSAIFITSDVVSLIIQAAGGGIAASLQRTPVNLVTRGGWIMFAGIFVQVISLTVFVILLLHLVWCVNHEQDKSQYAPRFRSVRERPLFKFFIPAIAISVMFIWIRSVYRLVELGEGWDGHLMNTERYFLALDGLMILLGCIPFLVHPGMMLGKEKIPVEGLHTKPGQKINEDIDPGKA